MKITIKLLPSACELENVLNELANQG